MAVAFDAKFSGASGPGSDTVEASGATTSSNTKLTIGSGSNRALFVVACYSQDTGARTAKWNSINMTEVDSFRHNFVRLSLFKLMNPDSGNNTMQLDWTTACDIYIGAIALTGVDQSDPVVVADTQHSVANGDQTVTVPSATGDMTLAALVCNSNYPGLNFNQWFKDNPLAHGAGGSYQSDGSSNGHTFTGQGGSDTEAAGWHIKAAGGATNVTVTGVTASAPAAGIAGAFSDGSASVTGATATAPAAGNSARVYEALPGNAAPPIIDVSAGDWTAST